MKKYSIEINEYKYYDDDVKELSESKVSEYTSLDEALSAWSEFYYEYAAISFHGDASDGEYYYIGGEFSGEGSFSYDEEGMTYVVYIYMKDEEGKIVDIHINSESDIKLNNETVWVARPSGDITLEVFDETIKKQIVKIDIKKSGIIKSGENRDKLCRSINDLSIITLFPKIFASLFELDVIISKIPMNQG